MARWDSTPANGHVVVLASDGTVWAWGGNAYGQVGDGTTTDQVSPVQVPVPAGATPVDVNVGHYTSSLLTSDGTVYAWGRNMVGQIGDGTQADSSVPVSALAAPIAVSGVTVDTTAAPAFSYAPATGVVSFTTPAHAAATVDVTVDTSSGGRLTYPLSYTYGAPPVFTTGSAPAGTAGSAYTFTVGSVGTGAPTYTVTAGALPAGLSLNSATGEISGTPATAGSSSFTITATNAFGVAAQANTISVAAAPAGGSSATGSSPTTGSSTAAPGAKAPKDKDLANTGTDSSAVATAVAAGGLLVVAGAVVLAIRMRRRTR